MLEKIGLPAKPSLRRNNWVVDASHCQGCSSQFTFINRKHHCRRCGGLFCNSCTQQRIFLRGQGDSPVRICEPCKKLEEAARFETRHNYKNRAGKGSSKLTPKHEDEVLSQILGTDANGSSSSDLASNLDRLSNNQKASISNSGSSITETATYDSREVQSEIGSASPEELRQQALEEKKKYKILKGKGKSEEALKAFKRSKELERQAEALEISIRRNRKKVMSSGNVAEVQSKDGAESSKRHKSLRLTGKEKDDFVAELRELGWSDDEDKKPVALNLEGELSSLLREVPTRITNQEKSHGIDNTQVVALKRKALMLKREGKLAEAKEELKKAKVLERQLEEQELLAGAEDSDDELSAIIHSMDDDREDDLLGQYEQAHDFDVGHLVGNIDDLVHGNFDVTDEDLVDPEIGAALKSLGWTEDSGQSESFQPQPVAVDREGRLDEIQSLKREALNQKRAGNVAEAMASLKKAKLLEKELEAADTQSKPVLRASGNNYAKGTGSKLAPKSKLAIQKELLAMKRKALALRREGKLDEAEEELKKGQALQNQLDELHSSSSIGSQNQDFAFDNDPGMSGNSLVDEGEVDVTDRDLHDPKYLSLLRSLGWNDENHKLTGSSSETFMQAVNLPGKLAETQADDNIPVMVSSRRSKAEIQRELLGLKRKALAFRREGKTDEAEEVLKTAKALEAEMAEIDTAKNFQADRNQLTKKPVDPTLESVVNGDEDVTEKDMQDPSLLSVLKNLGWEDEEPKTVTMRENLLKGAAGNSLYSTDSSVAARNKGQIQRELLDLKRKALAHRRKGETEEAEELLRQATILEVQMAELEAPKKEPVFDASEDRKFETAEALLKKEKHGTLDDETGRSKSLASAPNTLNDMDDELLAGFGRKETKTTYSSIGNYDPSVLSSFQPIGDSHSLFGAFNPSSQIGVPSASETVEGRITNQSNQPANVMDLLTGDLYAKSRVDSQKGEGERNLAFGDSSLAKPALQPVNELQSRPTTVKTEMLPGEEKPDNYCQANSAQIDTSQCNQDSLRQEILAHKRKAVALKREGKLTEAREELRQAKLLEKNLEGDNVPQPKIRPADTVSTSQAPSVKQKESSPSNLASKPMSGRDRFKLQQESLGHKRQALKLRREGKLQEAEAEFELAKTLEAQLEESTAHESSRPEPVDDVIVEDLLDPQLLSALKAIGLDDVNVVSKTAEKPSLKQSPETVKSNPVKRDSPDQERILLEERIKAEKVKAVSLKRAGKQAEALDALRRAKLYEKKLNALA